MPRTLHGIIDTFALEAPHLLMCVQRRCFDDILYKPTSRRLCSVVHLTKLLLSFLADETLLLVYLLLHRNISDSGMNEMR